MTFIIIIIIINHNNHHHQEVDLRSICWDLEWGHAALRLGRHLHVQLVQGSHHYESHDHHDDQNGNYNDDHDYHHDKGG